MTEKGDLMGSCIREVKLIIRQQLFFSSFAVMQRLASQGLDEAAPPGLN